MLGPCDEQEASEKRREKKKEKKKKKGRKAGSDEATGDHSAEEDAPAPPLRAPSEAADALASPADEEAMPPSAGEAHSAQADSSRTTSQHPDVLLSNNRAPVAGEVL